MTREQLRPCRRCAAEPLTNDSGAFFHRKQKQVLVGVGLGFLAACAKIPASYDSEEECDYWSKLQQSSIKDLKAPERLC